MSVVVFLCGLGGGESYYATLEKAVAAVPTTGEATTITMVADATVEAGVTIAAEKSIILELNGKTISGNTDSNTTYALITNRGTLVIQDNTDTQKDGTGDGLITTYITNPDQGDIPGYASNTITNNGNLTVKSGKIVNNGSGYACYAIDNQTNGNLYTPVVRIEGGRMQQMNAKTYAVRMFCNSTTKSNTVEVSGGVIEGGYGLWLQTPNAKENIASLTINGGVLNANDGAALYVGGTKAVNSSISINITGGTINGSGAMFQGPLSGTYGSISISGGDIQNVQCGANVEHFISGGTFHVAPNEAYIALGYEAVQSESGNNWNVKKQEGLSSMDYTTFNTALLNANGVWDTPVNVILKESQRDIQNSNTTAQFYLNRIKSINVDGTEGNITIKNVTFTYEPDDNDINLTVGELQPPLTGTLTIEDCTFIGVSVSPWGMLNNASSCPQKAEFKNCTFKDLSGRYGVHQNKAIELIVTGCTFENMQRGIHTNCPSAAAVTIKNNSFTGIDATKGVICLAEGNVFTNTEFDVSGNNAAGQTFLRQLNTTITAAQLNAILADNTYGTAYTSGSTIPSE